MRNQGNASDFEAYSASDFLALEALIKSKMTPKAGETWRLQLPGDIEFTRVMKVQFIGILNTVLSGKTFRNVQIHFIERIEDESK